MKLGIIAGNRLLPIILARRIKQKNKNSKIIALCFKGETSQSIRKYVDKTYWINAGRLGDLKQVLGEENLEQCVMAGQINPLRIFRRSNWDEELISLMAETRDFRPHTIFKKIITYLEREGVTFLDSTLYLKEDLAEEGVMNGLNLDEEAKKDINFGIKVISRFVELDVGQIIVVKKGCVAALESLEGTDGTVKRAFKLAGGGCTVLKFSKINQDLRFDVPVVGISTLRLLRRIRAASLILEKEKVIILQKSKFLSLAKKWKIAVVGMKADDELFRL